MGNDWEGFISKGDFNNPEAYRSIYTSELFDTLAPYLGISSESKRDKFEKTALGAAGVYEMAKNSQSLKVPQHKEVAAMKSVARAANKLNSNITDALKLSFLNSIRLGNGIREIKHRDINDASPEFKKILRMLSNSGDGEGSVNMGLVLEFLNFFEHAAQASADDKKIRNTASKNTAVESWLYSLQFSWAEFSDLAFSPGRFHSKEGGEEGGYENYTLHVLTKLMDPLDRNVKRPQIESSLRAVCSSS